MKISVKTFLIRAPLKFIGPRNFYQKALLLAFPISILVACAGPNLNQRFSTMRTKYQKIQPTLNVGDDKVITITKLNEVQKPFYQHIPGREIDSLQLKNGKPVDIYYMRIAWYPDDLQTDDEYTPYIFVDDKLAAVGWDILGGAKTKHDPERVEQYNRMQLEMALQRAAIYNRMADSLNRRSQQFNMQERQQFEQHNEMIRQQQMNELNRNLKNLNQKLGN